MPFFITVGGIGGVAGIVGARRLSRKVTFLTHFNHPNWLFIAEILGPEIRLLSLLLQVINGCIKTIIGALCIAFTKAENRLIWIG